MTLSSGRSAIPRPVGCSRSGSATLQKSSSATKKRSARIRNRGENAIVVNTIRDTGANVIEAMRGIRKVVDDLNRDVLPSAGLVMKQVRDDTVYINFAIGLVTQNIWIGGTLAAIILLMFLRSFGATAVISLAIPVSIIGSFVALAALGRSINVISLAGIAFAVGMVVDAAIVVLEKHIPSPRNGARQT